MKPAANANRMFMPMENWGGLAGSQRQRGGVHVRIVQALRHVEEGVAGNVSLDVGDADAADAGRSLLEEVRVAVVACGSPPFLDILGSEDVMISRSLSTNSYPQLFVLSLLRLQSQSENQRPEGM